MHFDFLEIQSVYHGHFLENQSRLGEISTSLHFMNENYTILSSGDFLEKYDLILCNPPYFRVQQGTLSPSEFKNRCRFFMDADFRSLISGIENSLAPGGEAYVLLRSLADHGMSYAEEASSFLAKSTHFERISDIRGTGLYRFRKIGS